MQALWSRAAQTRSSCRCNACLHAASAIARRTTTVASRRRLKTGDLFTACYSTILGTAAFADAKAKEDRRKEWDRAIAEAKAGIPAVDSPDRIERTVPDDNRLQGLPSVVRPIFSDSKLVIRAVQNVDLQLTLDLHLKQSLETSHKTSPTSHSPELEVDWTDERDVADPIFPARDPVNRLHVDKMEGMVSKLVTRLLVRSRELSRLLKTPVSSAEISRQMKEIATRLESLQGIDTRLPSYTFHDPEAAGKERWKLNSTLEALFKQTAPDCSNIHVIIAKICYNLLVSSSPPSIQTYDILIRCLTRLKLPELAQIVVDSFLFESKFTPTSTTVQLILDHYSAQKDERGFRAIVKRMRAVDGDMRIKKRSINSLYKPAVQEWALTRKVLQKGGYLREKVCRDSNIFDSLIKGFLELDKLRSAVRYVRAALREGVQLSSETFYGIVMACIKAMDHKAGLLVLRALLGQWEGNSISTVVYSAQTRFAIHRLFGLCGIEQSLESIRPLPYRVSRAAVMNLQRHMSILSLEEELHRLSTHLMSMETILATVGGTFGGVRIKHIGKALSICNAAFELERGRSLKKETYIEKDATLREATLGDRNDWLAAQYEKLSSKWKEKYAIVTKYNPHLCWADRIEIISIYQHGKNISRKHCLYGKISWPKNLCSLPATTTKQANTAEEDIVNRKKSKNPLPSLSKKSREGPSQTSHHNLAVPRTPATLALGLPLSPTHDYARVEAAAG